MKNRKITAMVTAITVILSCIAPWQKAGAAPGITSVSLAEKATETMSIKELREKLDEAEEDALEWLCATENANGIYGDDSIIKDTCEVLTLLSDTASREAVSDDEKQGSVYEINNSWIETEKSRWATDNDSLARLYCATGESGYIDRILQSRNRDGGYGITAEYKSDIPDTVLVLEALVRRYGEDAGLEQNIEADVEEGIEAAILYLANHQNNDGGFSYIQGNSSDILLTVKVGVVLWSYKAYSGEEYIENLLSRIDTYAEDKLAEINIAQPKMFEAAVALYRYQCLRRDMEDSAVVAEWLIKLQNEDGSWYQDIDSTIAAVRLLYELEEYIRPEMTVETMETTLSAYTVYAGHSAKIDVQSEIDYSTNYACDVLWHMEVMDEGTLIHTEEITVSLKETEYAAEVNTDISLAAAEEGSYDIVIKLIADDIVLAENKEEIRVIPIEILPLQLNGAQTQEGVALEWNDISNDIYRYGYRIYRMTENGYETISVWNGEETVKVLNIYPCASAANHLTNWLTSNLASEGIPAGKGLFEIDKVLITNYNRNPEYYLLNSDGTYKYDVLYFGASDRNSEIDLSQLSYQATQDFVDSGRGVLFGHDTVCLATDARHYNFAKFADQLGVKLGTGGEWVGSSQAKVVNTGFLTSYPWKIEGVISIPLTHSYQQYTGGTLQSTVWIELANAGYKDEETGAWTSGYLFTRNQLGMIQTGHSNGKATDDERKVLANTLFYLKQLTDTTSTVDKSAYDTAAPGLCEIMDMEITDAQVTYRVAATDCGTEYVYYAEAVPYGEGNEEYSRTSQEVAVTVTSGICGYAACVNTSPDRCKIEDYTVILAEVDGTALITHTLEENTTNYLHICGIDNQGNYGEETIIEIQPESDKDNIYDVVGDMGYALYGAEDVTVYCSEMRTAGKIYSGGNFTFGGSVLQAASDCNAAGRIYAYAGQIMCAGYNENVRLEQMPWLHVEIMNSMQEVDSTEALYLYNSAVIDTSTYCREAAIYCPQVDINKTLMCEGSINVGVNSINCGLNGDVILYSVNGDIRINATHLSGSGVIYAPNGTVSINVADMNYSGSIIAKRISIQGSYITIEQ